LAGPETTGTRRILGGIKCVFGLLIRCSQPGGAQDGVDGLGGCVLRVLASKQTGSSAKKLFDLTQITGLRLQAMR